MTKKIIISLLSNIFIGKIQNWKEDFKAYVPVALLNHISISGI
jgi:hypothetical protein